MAFGNRPKSRVKSGKVSSKAAPEDTEDELLSWSEKNPGKLQGIVAFGSLFVAACLLIVSAPHTHAAKKVRYSGYSLAEGAMSGGLLEEYKAEAEARLGVHFGRILTPASEETTPAMKRVAEACLPKGKYARMVMPSVGSQLHTTYANATDYLICAMRQERGRLCESHERKRLAEQLTEYRDRRQNVLAQERVVAKTMESASAQYQIEMTRKVREDALNQPAGPAMTRSIGADIDPRVASEIRNLVANGYFAASDFGWLGLYLPEEYVPFLATDRQAKACG